MNHHQTRSQTLPSSINIYHQHHMIHIIINPLLLFIPLQIHSIINYLINDECISDHVLSIDMFMFGMVDVLLHCKVLRWEGSGPLCDAKD